MVTSNLLGQAALSGLYGSRAVGGFNQGEDFASLMRRQSQETYGWLTVDRGPGDTMTGKTISQPPKTYREELQLEINEWLE